MEKMNSVLVSFGFVFVFSTVHGCIVNTHACLVLLKHTKKGCTLLTSSEGIKAMLYTYFFSTSIMCNNDYITKISNFNKVWVTET